MKRQRSENNKKLYCVCRSAIVIESNVRLVRYIEVRGIVSYSSRNNPDSMDKYTGYQDVIQV